MAYCIARDCRTAGLQLLAGFCRKHFDSYVEATAAKPIMMFPNWSYCYACGRMVQFSMGLYESHFDDNAIKCTASGREIAILRAS